MWWVYICSIHLKAKHGGCNALRMSANRGETRALMENVGSFNSVFESGSGVCHV